MKRCPFCAEDIRDAAIICRWCNRDLPGPAVATTMPDSRAATGPPPPWLATAARDQLGCPVCGRTMRATDADVLQAATVGATPQASSASLLVKDWRAWALGAGMVVLIVAGPIWIETVRRPETAVRTQSETASLDDPSQLSAVASAAEPGNPGPPPEPTDQSRELAPAPSAVVAAAPASARTKPEPPVRADELVAAYQRNAIAADRRYKGQIVDIAGAVVWVGKDVFGNPYVTFGRDGATSVQATFPRGSDNILADLSPDQPIVVRCRVEGKLVSVSVRDCLLQ